MADIARLSINSATIDRRLSLERCVDACVRHAIPAIAPWRHKIHDIGVKQAARVIRDSGLEVSGVCRGGMFTGPDKAARARSLDDNRRAVDEAAALGAHCLVLVVGGLPEGSRDLAGAHDQVRDGIAALLEHARAANVPLAIEPLHPMYAAERACINTLRHANDLCEELGAGLGVAIDVYHLWWDDTLRNEIARAAGRILGYHVCDWLVPTTDLLLDRGMMGDGIIDIRQISGWVAAAGYEGYVEVEIFSAKNWWLRDPEEVLDITCRRFQKHV